MEIPNHRNGIGKAAAILVAVGTLLGSMLGGWLFVDARWVHADTYATDQKNVTSEIRGIHRARIEDEIFKLQLIPLEKRSTVDNAILNRYQNQLREMDTQEALKK